MPSHFELDTARWAIGFICVHRRRSPREPPPMPGYTPQYGLHTALCARIAVLAGSLSACPSRCSRAGTGTVYV